MSERRCCAARWPSIPRSRCAARSTGLAGASPRVRRDREPTALSRRSPMLRATDAPVRVTVVSPEPTPYRSPLFDRVARRPGVELTVVYAGRTVAGRTWQVEPEHHAVVLDGVRVPGVRRLLRHEYPVTPGIRRALDESEPDVVVVSGWSQFASQAAIAWCRRRRIPYLLLVSSHDAVTRSAWRRAVRAPIVPRVVRGAWGAFALGTLSRASLVANGARPERVRLFANTIDVPAWVERADRLAGRRPELRDALGLSGEDVAVLSVARLAPEKGLDTLLRAAAAADPRLVVVIAGEGPERRRLRRSGARAGRPSRPRWRRALGAHRRDLRCVGRVRPPLRLGAVGRRRQRGRCLRAAARALRPGRCGAGPAASTARTAPSSPPATWQATAAALARYASDTDARGWRRAPGAGRSCGAGATSRASSPSSPPCARRPAATAASVPPMPGDRKRRLLVLNQYYWPGVEATAQLLAQLCEALAEDFEVTVVTGRLRGHPELPAEEMRGGVRIVRVQSSAYERSQLHLRAANYVTYLVDSVLRRAPRGSPGPRDLHDRPADRRRHRARGGTAFRRAAARDQPGRVPRDRRAPEAAGEPRPRRRPATRSSRLYLKRADRVVAIGDTMKLRLEEKGTPATDHGDPELGRHRRDHAAAARQRLGAGARPRGRVSWSCTPATSVTRRISTASSAPRRSCATRRLRIVIAGFGARHGELTRAGAAARGDGRSVPALPAARGARESLSSADLHYVGLARGLAGLSSRAASTGSWPPGGRCWSSADEEPRR